MTDYTTPRVFVIPPVNLDFLKVGDQLIQNKLIKTYAGGGEWINSQNDIEAPGVSFYVKPTGDAGADGLSWDNAVDTIQAAIDKTVSGRGDIIFVAPGTYEENLDTTGKNSITIIGAFPGGYDRPDIAPTTETALTAHSDAFVCIHCRFVAADAAHPAVIQQGNGFFYGDCVFDGDGNTGSLFQLMGDKNDSHYSASEGKVIGNLFRGSGGSGLEFKNPGAPDPGGDGGVAPSDNLIEGNTFIGNTDGDIVDTVVAGGDGQSFLRGTIKKNIFTDDKHGSAYITLDTGTPQSGIILENTFGDQTGISATEIAVTATIGVAKSNTDCS